MTDPPSYPRIVKQGTGGVDQDEHEPANGYFPRLDTTSSCIDNTGHRY